MIDGLMDDDLLPALTAMVESEDDPDRLDTLIAALIEVLARASLRSRAARPLPEPPPRREPPEWLSVDDLARLIGRSVSTIRHLPPDAIPGRRQFVRGGKVAWNRRMVIDWLEACNGQGL